MHVPAISLAAFLTLASTLTSALPFAAPEPQQHPLKLTPHPHESYKGSVQEAVPLVPGQ